MIPYIVKIVDEEKETYSVVDLASSERHAAPPDRSGIVDECTDGNHDVLASIFLVDEASFGPFNA